MALVGTSGSFTPRFIALAAAATINSVSPSCAAPGATVVITGNGFGAKNVTIKVGGATAQVMSATGNKVTFIVPAALPAGMTTVTATNPGGHSGSIPLQVTGPEICGNHIDEDCDSQLDDPDICQHINSPPVADAGPDQTVSVGVTVQLDGSASSDVDGDLLTYYWTSISRPADSTATLADPTEVTPSFVVDKPGTYVIELRVNDGITSSTPDTVTISTLNSAPVANAGPDQTALVGATVQLDGSASHDVDGDLLTYQWTLLTQPVSSTSTLLNPTVTSPLLVIDTPGTYTVQLVVHDGMGDSPPDTVTISTMNSMPTANAGPDQEAIIGLVVQLDGSSSSDVDGDPLTYQWSLVAVPPESNAMLTDTDSVLTSFVPDMAGIYVAQLIVHDRTVESEPDTALVTIIVPPPPVDTDPPPPPDLELITVGPVTSSQVTVTSAAGSIEAGATVTLTNLRTGEAVTVTANANGSFTAQIAAQAGDRLSIVATDAAGNVSPAGTLQVSVALSVTITQPVHGATVPGDHVLVHGTVEAGGVEVGVTVNGLLAAVQGTTFAVIVPVTPDLTSITAQAISSTGTTASDTIALAVTPAPAPVLRLSASSQRGVAPSPVTFSLLIEGVAPTHVELDADADGQVDFSEASIEEVTFTYTQPGLYFPTATLIDDQGQRYTASSFVQVDDRTTLDTLLQAKWAALKDALRQGDIAQALTYIGSRPRLRYEAIFQALAADLPDIDSILTTIQLLDVRGTEVLYEMVRTDDEITKSFELRFRVDADGLWRLWVF